MQVQCLKIEYYATPCVQMLFLGDCFTKTNLLCCQIVVNNYNISTFNYTVVGLVVAFYSS